MISILVSMHSSVYMTYDMIGYAIALSSFSFILSALHGGARVGGGIQRCPSGPTDLWCL